MNDNTVTNFHPELDFITEFAAGSLPLAQSACVSLHITHCRHCQQTAGQLADLGANLFEAQEPMPVDDILLHAVLARLDEEKPLEYANKKSSEKDTPAILQRLMRGDFSDLSWKNIGATLRISYLKTGDPDHEVALYHIRAGGRIPEHTHRGTEMTLILEGGFSDANGSYHKGDFLVRRADDVHAPTALQSEDCICLAVLDAPLKFTDWKFRWMNPFLKLRTH
ncbi:MAG: ChrR family anti-sigma-E factor [Halioglobus sp.]|nr:ChrR family anti-sigma-E factor [Halioglobus sp.]